MGTCAASGRSKAALWLKTGPRGQPVTGPSQLGRKIFHITFVSRHLKPFSPRWRSLLKPRPREFDTSEPKNNGWEKKYFAKLNSGSWRWLPTGANKARAAASAFSSPSVQNVLSNFFLKFPSPGNRVGCLPMETWRRLRSTELWWKSTTVLPPPFECYPQDSGAEKCTRSVYSTSLQPCSPPKNNMFSDASANQNSRTSRPPNRS